MLLQSTMDPNPGCIEHHPVYCRPSDALGLWQDGRVFVKDPIRWLAHGSVSHIAGSAGMSQGFARTRKARNQSLDFTAVVAVRGVDDTVRRPRFVLQQCRIVERANHRLDAVRRHRAGPALIANETANLMTICNQRRSDRATDEPWHR